MGIGEILSSALIDAGMSELPVYLFFLAIGLVIIIKGGDWFVDAASWFAEVSGIPKLIVGATVVSLATTLPELLVSIFAALGGHDLLAAGDTAAANGMVDMSIGNAVGSVTANLGLILAIAMIAMPTVIRIRDYARKMALMCSGAVIIVLFGLLSHNGLFAFNWLPAMLLLIVFCIAVWDNVHAAKTEMALTAGEAAEREKPTRNDVIANIIKFLFGTAFIVFGADLLVDNASGLASHLGVPDRVIGVTIVAIGTSLPELVTTITAIVKKQASLSAGNIIGANIIDLALILPACSLIYGGELPVTANVARFDLPACLVLCAAAVIPSLVTRKFSRWQGILMLCLYAGYLALTCFVAG